MLVSIATPPPNYTGGARGFLAAPAQEGRFRSDLRRAMRFADALGVPFVHVLTGPPVDEPAEATESRMLDNLTWAAQQPGKARLLLSAGADTALLDPAQSAALVERVNAPKLRLLIDTCAVMACSDTPGAMIAAQAPLAEVVAVATGPARAQPDPSKTDISAMLLAAGFEGWVSAAYSQQPKDARRLDWAKGLREPH